MKKTSMLLVLACFVIGCAQPADDTATSDASDAAPTLGESSDTTEPSVEANGHADEPEAAGSLEVVNLTAENTTVQFVGKHTDKSKDDRIGTFGELSGTIEVGADGGPTSISVEIQAASLDTTMEQLNTHLKSADFLEVREYPTLSFESSSITADGDAGYTVSGTLTLHGVEQEISFPASVNADGGFELHSEFVIDRTNFEINYGLENVEKEVSITVDVNSGT